MSRVVVIGSGHVGSCAAFLLAMKGTFEEVVLLDKRAARAQAEAADMMAALPRLGASADVRGGDYADCSLADMVVLCAAAPVKLGQTRNDMFAKNVLIAKDAVCSAESAGFSGTYLVVTNPVEHIVRYLVEGLGVSPDRVVGTGTLLDSMRLEGCLRRRYGSAVKVSALAIGEHGEGLVVDWTHTLVNGAPVPAGEREALRREAIDAAYDIMKGKGSTSYGIAQAVVTIAEAWGSHDGTTLPLSVWARSTYGLGDVCVALPATFTVGHSAIPSELSLDEETRALLAETAHSMGAFYEGAVGSLRES